MKKTIYAFIILFTLAAAFIVSGCSDQKTDERVKADSSQVYTCPMHPEVVSNEPGLCPECNMNLVLKEDSSGSTDQVYTCPMHPEVTSDEPGLCPECNMNLVPKEEAHDHSEMESSSTSKMEQMPEMASSSESDSKVQQYTCGMHPHVVTNEPGVCPICNMNLVPKVDRGKGDGTVLIDPTTRQNMAMATTKVGYMKLTKTIRAYGKVSYSEPEQFSVNVKIKGYVEKLYVNETGVHVKSGEPLLEIYSPELVAAQNEYLIAYKSFDFKEGRSSTVRPRLLGATYSRLKNWDIPDEQIKRLSDSGEAAMTMTIESPYTGTVTGKFVQEGDYIFTGQELFKIADLSSVWISAYIYEQDLPEVSVGQEVIISLPSLIGSKIVSNITYVSPFLNSNRQAEIRVEIDNQQGTLKPEMFAEVNIKSQLPEPAMVIPRSAIINSGTRQLVFVETGPGEFKARNIKTGMVADGDMVEVLEGLETGEEVVVSGQFMLDSETRLNEAIADNSGGGNAHQHH